MEELKKHLSTDCIRNEDDEISYSLNSLRKDFEIVELHNGVIAYRINDLWMDFYVFNFHCGKHDDEDYILFWNGQGTLGNLKELRHSYFQEYVFYANLKLIEQASQWLQTYFE